MNIARLKHYWYPIMEEKKLRHTPIATALLGIPLVIGRMKGEMVCFEDRCPHRNVPLSEGSIAHQHLRCGYHGWEFDALGKLHRIPGCHSCPDTLHLKSYQIHGDHGIIWVLLEGNRPFENPFSPAKGWSSRFHHKVIKADFIHTIENFLDPTHTPFIHKGLLRQESQQRMTITQKSDEKGFTTHYTLLDRQNGLINRLFDRGIDENIASFELPGYARIDYRQAKELLFQVAIFFVPIDKGEVGMVINVALLKTIIPSTLKFLLLRPFMEVAFRQDKIILEKQYITHQRQKIPYIITQADLVIDHLLYLLADGEKGKEKTVKMAL